MAGSDATGCVFTTDKFEVTVYQVLGSVQAALHPDTEAWSAPYTWWVASSASLSLYAANMSPQVLQEQACYYAKA